MIDVAETLSVVAVQADPYSGKVWEITIRFSGLDQSSLVQMQAVFGAAAMRRNGSLGQEQSAAPEQG
jgi:hypothetical protein